MSAAKKQRTFWRRLRIYFRRFRITIWLIVLCLLGSAIYVNQIGLPGFIKKPLLEKLRERGIDLRFSRLRIRWYQGLVAENVRFGRPDESSGPNLRLEQVQVHVNHTALLHFKMQVDSLTLRKGRLVWPVYATNAPPAASSQREEANLKGSGGRGAGTNQPRHELALENLQTDLRLLPGDEWSLDDFTATFAGARLHLSGAITNASSIRDWTFFHGQKRAPLQAAIWQKRLNSLAETLDKIHFPTAPDLILNVRGDGRDPQSFLVRVMVNTPGAETPWGTVKDGKCIFRIYPRGTNEDTHAELTLEAGEAKTPWAAGAHLGLSANVFALGGESNLLKTTLKVSVGQVETKWGAASGAHLDAVSIHTATNPIPLSGEALVTCSNPTSRWGTAQSARLRLALDTREPATLPHSDNSWSYWEKILPYTLNWDCDLAAVKSPKLEVAKLRAGGAWRAPQLSITNLNAKLYGGELDGAADLDVATRMVSARLRSDFEVRDAQAVMTEGGRRWLSQYSWQIPPKVIAGLNVTLPAWTNRHPNWQVEVRPTLVLDGEFNAEHGGAFRDVPVTTAHSHFTYSNMTWHIPDLVATRPEGQLRLFLVGDDRTKQFYFHLNSLLDPMLARPFLPTNGQRGFDLVKFSKPPSVDAEIWGRWHHHEETGFKAIIAVTNFSFRGQGTDGLQAQVEYTNKTLLVKSPRLQRGSETASADFLFADFAAEKIWLTNGFSTLEPMVVARAIGPHIAKHVEAYHFDLPPAGRVNGIIPMRHETDADLHFEIIGGPFNWWKITMPQIAGNIDWVGEHLTLRNVRGDFYGGHATGQGHFDFRPHKGADYRFSVNVSNAVLRALLADIAPKTNALEGLVSGNVVITKANTSVPNALEGYGDVQLREGLLWAIPMFGALSPALDSISPGLGSSHASSGSGNFTITNGVIHSDDLEIRSPAMRLQYRGSVALAGKVDARVDAVLLRDMWVVGPLVSTVFWPFTKLFEYQITGSLAHPKLEPVYLVPKIVTMPFHPFRSIKDMMPEDQSPPGPSPPDALMPKTGEHSNPKNAR